MTDSPKRKRAATGATKRGSKASVPTAPGRLAGSPGKAPTTESRALAKIPDELPQFPYQLADVYLYEATLRRRQEPPEDNPARPRFRTRLDTADLPERSGFTATLTVEVKFSIRSGASCTVNVSTIGVFAHESEVSTVDGELFRSSDCALLIWPYARANVGELVRMTGLKLPPLPTVDVRQALKDLSLPATALE